MLNDFFLKLLQGSVKGNGHDFDTFLAVRKLVATVIERQFLNEL